MVPEISVTPRHARANVDFHRPFGNAESVGYFPLSDAFHLVQDDNLATTGWQRHERVSEQIDAFMEDGGFAGIGLFIYDPRSLGSPVSIERRIPVFANQVQGNTAGNQIKERFGGLNRLAGGCFPNAKIGFLYNIVYVRHGGIRATQISLKLPIIRMNLLGKPATSLRHSGNFCGCG